MNLELATNKNNMNIFNYNINYEKTGCNMIKINDLMYDKQRDIIGKGAFSFVYKTYYKNNIVALKTIVSRQYFGTKIASTLEHEIKILKSANHPNIIKLIGVLLDARGMGILLEYCQGGTLADIIHKWQIKDFLICLKFLRQICNGMSYLHNDRKENRAIYIHRDLKPQNILIKEKICDKRSAEFPLFYKLTCTECKDGCSFIGNVTLKIADFGLSKINNENCSQIKGTIPYMAPEANQKICSTKSDIYSFSIILWEMINLESPIQGRNRENILEDQRLGKQILKMNGNTPPFLVKIFDACHSYNSNDRPSFYEIEQLILIKLGKLMEKLEKNKINIYNEILNEQNTNILKINNMIQINKKERINEFTKVVKDFEKLNMKINNNSFLSTIWNHHLIEKNSSTKMSKNTCNQNNYEKNYIEMIMKSKPIKINILTDWDVIGSSIGCKEMKIDNKKFFSHCSSKKNQENVYTVKNYFNNEFINNIQNKNQKVKVINFESNTFDNVLKRNDKNNQNSIYFNTIQMNSLITRICCQKEKCQSKEIKQKLYASISKIFDSIKLIDENHELIDITKCNKNMGKYIILNSDKVLLQRNSFLKRFKILFQRKSS